jgi:hypothetical protein
MIKYYDKIILSLSEIKDQPSLLIHSLTGCMFHCFHCINYDELIAKEHSNYYTIDDVIKVIKQQEQLYKNIIISGGEYLLAPLDLLIDDLKRIKEATKKPIIIYTTGIELKKMEKLNELKLIDGFHIDMKLPYHLINDQDFDLIEMTMGIKIHSLSLIHRLDAAIEFVIKNDLGYSQVRSVRYPFLDESAFLECKLRVDKLNNRYNKNTPYLVNRFMYNEEGKSR